MNDSVVTNLTYKTGTLRCPPNCLAHITAAASITTATTTFRLFIRRGGDSDGTSNGNSFAGIGSTGSNNVMGNGMVMVNASSEIQYTGDEPAGTLTIAVRLVGFLMLTRGQKV
jgi:hypothetical protein